MTTIARQGRRGALASSGGWSRTGLVGEWGFESSGGTDTAGNNDLTIVAPAVVAPAINSLGLETNSIGYAINTAIDSALKVLQGTSDIYLTVNADTNQQHAVKSWATNVTLGSTTEIVLILEQRTIGITGSLQIFVREAGAAKILWSTDPGIIGVGTFRITITADNSGSATGYKLYVDGAPVAFTTKTVDTAGYGGRWVGYAPLAAIENKTINGIRRDAIVSNTLDMCVEFDREYDFVKTAAQIAVEQLIIGGEK